MGLFGLLKMIRDEKKKTQKNIAMSTDELLTLNDEDLYDAISDRLLFEEQDLEVEEVMGKFYGAKLTFYIVNYFSMEVNNGGLCQYFVNSSRLTAPNILDALKTIGADPYFDLLHSFVSGHHIDLTDLNSFIIENVDDFEAQSERYPFDEFDEPFYQLEENIHLEQLLSAYARLHIQDFSL